MCLLVFFLYIVFIAILTILIVASYLKISYQYWKKHGAVFVEPSSPFGNFQDSVLGKKHMSEVTQDIYRKLKQFRKPFMGIYVFFEAVVMAVDPKLIKNILGRDFNFFCGRGIYVDHKNDILSTHMFATVGEEWKNVKTKVSSAFTSGKLKLLFPTIQEVVNTLVEVLEERAEISEPVEIKELMAQYSIDIIGSCFFGIDSNCLRDPDEPLRINGRRFLSVETLEDVVRSMSLMSYPKLMKIFRIGIAQRDVDKYFKKIVKDMVDYREANDVERKDFMQILLQLKNNSKSNPESRFTLNDVMAQCFGFFMAGFETSSNTLTFLCYEIAKSLKTQEKIRKEIIQNCGRTFDYDSLSKLTYLDQVVAETLRKYPPIPILNRECDRDYPIPGGNYVIKKGQKVFVPVLALHRDPEYYPDPESFDPERFNPENKTVDCLPYLPFGDGPRYCVGKRFALLQMKLVVASVVTKFSLSLNPKTVEPITFDPRTIASLCPKNAIFVDFVRR